MLPVKPVCQAAVALDVGASIGLVSVLLCKLWVGVSAKQQKSLPDPVWQRKFHAKCRVWHVSFSLSRGWCTSSGARTCTTKLPILAVESAGALAASNGPRKILTKRANIHRNLRVYILKAKTHYDALCTYHWSFIFFFRIFQYRNNIYIAHTYTFYSIS